MKNLHTISIMAVALSSFAQDSEAELIKLYENGQYQQIISQYANRESLSAQGLYFVGMSYYMTEDDANSIKFMDLSIKKDPEYEGAYFIKGSTLYYMGNYNDAIANFKEALKRKQDPLFYSGLGDVYHKLNQLKPALEAYKQATQLPGCQPRSYYRVATIYNELNDSENSLKAFYTASEKIPGEDPLYVDVLFNIGLLEYLANRPDKAEPVFKKVLEAKPDDYPTYSKLMQVYYSTKQFDKAQPYKKMLYEAHKAGKLKGTPLSDMFCFDQFMHKGHRVMVFERYEEGPKNNIFNKQVFYVHDSNSKVVMTVQNEYSPVSVELGGTTYMLCASKGGAHYNSGLGFNDGFKYDDLKEVAVKMIDQHLD
ncbi:hypothetical protein AM493_05335 [Flavobacterium akiainvivens]|uniref:Uncharacterized protein n=1 Tax=Flavobacterium akiainvivens TaxID=1202724 RepID=A0A0M8MH66_9FLAO|nr:tetratricopeptide repeat protein [Flavobacterium akiainvivens]KOS05518.1 hypothetical protein AM493_05335 [Flavobacterium akiainvivens]SFQ33498.1 TPR repeat-containing protein [Flavobacterium akiainvivens]